MGVGSVVHSTLPSASGGGWRGLGPACSEEARRRRSLNPGPTSSSSSYPPFSPTPTALHQTPASPCRHPLSCRCPDLMTFDGIPLTPFDLTRLVWYLLSIPFSSPTDGKLMTQVSLPPSREVSGTITAVTRNPASRKRGRGA